MFLFFTSLLVSRFTKKKLTKKTAVGTLVSALKKQAKFRQLVEYSLDTLVKASSLPYVFNYFVCLHLNCRLLCLFNLFTRVVENFSDQ